MRFARPGSIASAVLSLLLFAPLAVVTAENDIEDALSGFDEPGADDNLEDTLSGFDDGELPVEDTESARWLSGENWRITGDTGVSAAWNYAHQRPGPGETDWRGLSRLRARLRPELRLDLGNDWDARVRVNGFYDFAYLINGRSGYTNQVLRHYESELEFQDTYLRGSLGTNLDIKLGRQIVVWGKSDNLRVVDVLNPLDRRQPGMTDIENLRLPVTMSRLDYFTGDWRVTALALHEVRFDKLPVVGSDFYPYSNPPPEEDDIHDGGSNTEYALALSAVMPGWDLSFHLARLFDEETHLAVIDDGAELVHARIDMLGAATNIVFADWLLKVESAYFDGLRYSAAPGKDFARTDLLLGVDYNGFDNTTLTLESALRHIHSYDRRLELGPVPYQRNRLETAFRYSADFLNDRWNAIIVATRFGEALNEGGITRIQLGYELRQALELTGGLVLYHGRVQWPFDSIADNDRVFLELKYSF
ncbi:DUF1302 family protein [Seongchinamella unica]|uniref:DUF1302 family protein n=1 Tax=Seongchinamella unica TaxID=2547392 RepID=A0A4R5LMY4_9GAMM|nr:DUF1302 family protein [Seongchinamella unica]